MTCKGGSRWYGSCMMACAMSAGGTRRRAPELLALLVLLGCGSESPESALAPEYRAQTEASCLCFAEHMGFSSEQACRDDYLSDYVGSSEAELGCFARLERRDVEGAVEALQCRYDAERRFTTCVEALACDATEGFDDCERTLFDRIAECPAMSEDALTELETCIEERSMS